MLLTLKNRILLCWEILTVKSGHAHPAQEKQLSIFQRGYSSGLSDGIVEGKLENQRAREMCAQRAAEVVWSLSQEEARENIKRAVLNA